MLPCALAGQCRSLRLLALTVVALTLVSSHCDAQAQSVAGIAIGSPMSAVRQLNGTPADSLVNPPIAIRDFMLASGSQLEVTIDTDLDAVLWLHLGWAGNPEDAATDFGGFVFGKTTLAAIRKVCGSNGFCHLNGLAPAFENRGKFMMLNCYDVVGPEPLVVGFVTEVAREDVEAVQNGTQGDTDLGDKARLSWIILASRTYMDAIWGEKRVSDDPCPPVVWARW